MKKLVLAAASLAATAAAAEAQITVTYTRESSDRRLHVRFSAGSYSSYGYSCYGFGPYGYGGTVRHAVAPGVVAGAYHPWGAGYHFGYPGYAYYAGPVRPLAPAVVRPRQVPERSAENVASALLDQGRKRLKAGDYRGAVDDIRSAVLEDEAGGTSEAWFALALAITGDGRHADKALRSALGHGFKGAIELELRDKKEESRVAALLEKASGEGAAAAAYALLLLGRPEKLEALAKTDATLAPLLPED